MMARLDIEFQGLGELLDQQTDDLAKEMLDEAVPVLQEEVKKELRKKIKHEGESELLDSIRHNKAKQAKTGNYIVNVYPTGYSKTKIYHHTKTGRKYKVSNALKMIWKEYGIPGQQSPQPFLETATKNAEEKTLEIMQKVYDKRTGV